MDHLKVLPDSDVRCVLPKVASDCVFLIRSMHMFPGVLNSKFSSLHRAIDPK